MTKYAKLDENGNLSLAPKNNNGVINFNLNKKLLKAYGYKELIEADKPTNGRKYQITYSQSNDSIEEIIDFLETEEEYEKRKINEELQIEIDNLSQNLQNIDLKRIRAVCEPCVKDPETGETWLDYYNAQILDLREQIQELQERIDNDITQ